MQITETKSAVLKIDMDHKYLKFVHRICMNCITCNDCQCATNEKNIVDIEKK